jgi:hypothetical protein
MFKKTENQRSNQPEKLFRAGALSVSVWKREQEKKGEAVRVFYSATASRAYTEDDGATWKYSDSFGRDELPVIADLMRAAFMWIVSQESKQ